jgi:acetolactate synthase-1/2/3 large subunit
MRVSDYIANRLADAGFADVFLVTGGGAMHLNDAFGRHPKIKVTCFHHEQAAAIAAEGYARIKQKPCALNVTTGPGGINALVGVYGAYVDSVPMFVVSGQVKLETIAASFPNIPMRQLGDQEVDIVSMVKPVVKYVKAVKSASEVKQAMDRALFLMTNGRPGPVWLDVPIDIQGAILPAELLDGEAKGLLSKAELLADEGCMPNTALELAELNQSQSIEILFEEALRRLKLAKRPVIVVGTGVSSPLARKLFLSLINELDISVVPGWNAMDSIPSKHKNFAGRPGTVGDRAGNFSVQNADYILVLGCRLNIRQVSYNWKSFGKNAFKVMVDVDSAELNKPTLSIDLKIQSLVENFLEFILSKATTLRNPSHANYRDWCVDKVSKYPVVQESYKQEGKLNPYYFLEELSKILPDDATVIAGNGSACVMTFQAFHVKHGQRIFTNSGCASMGYDLPAAIGASIASLGAKNIICIAGDGSIMMNLQELQTVQSLGLPIKIILLNNGGYLSIKLTQQAYFPDNVFGTGSDNGVSMPNFQNITKAFGLGYSRVQCIDELQSEEVRDQLNNKSPVLIEVFVDTEQGFLPKLASRKNEDGSMTSPELEDMAPFLSRDELQKNMLI